MKTEQTIAQFLNIKDFPFEIKDKNGNQIYLEDSDGYWCKCECDDAGNEIYFEHSTGLRSKHEYDDAGNEIYSENSDGYWEKCEHNAKGNLIYYETSNGYWAKREYDNQGNLIYFEDSDGTIVDDRPKLIIELTLQDIAKLKGVDVSQIRIKEQRTSI